uniref:FAM65 N-terminal domain-containing protein n=1 Tax=Anabas testudineus TaxID=64144 RepID=A0A7N6BSP4_ANATE
MKIFQLKPSSLPGHALPGSPSRTLSTMSLSVRPVRRLTSKSITRSQSFTGVNTYDKSYRNLSVFNTPGLSRKPSRARKMFNMSTKPNPTPKVPQPERLDQVYEALKKGLQSYLQVHQMDLDSLSRQMKESKRNSRLIDELYEAYCLQRRLRDGANKMVKAYTASPGSKEARESLAEANKGYKEYTENMCVLESELENQLGEFHIKMKGLAGFARLCAGDQYELFMRYGRQRWKLRGRIEINSKQVWDSEEMVFLPLINEFLSVKVTELKSLANHVVVGSVSCETKDLFAALPQTVAVDINDLGTIKLSLEVTWNPFDKDDQGSVASTINKAPTVSKRFSTIFNQSPPDTPSLREQAFYNMLRRHEEFENGAAWSNSSESSDDSSSPQLPVGGLRNSTHDKVTHKILCMEEENDTVTVMTKPDSEEEDTGKQSSSLTVDRVVNNNHTPRRYSRSLSHISESSADGIVLMDRSVGVSGEVMSLASGISINDIEMEMPRSPKPSSLADTDTNVSLSRLFRENTTVNDVTDEQSIREQQDTFGSDPTCYSPRTEGINPSTPSQINRHPQCNTLSESGDVTYVARRVPVVEEMPIADADCVSRESDGPVENGLEDTLGAVISSLDDYRGQFPELQLLEEELKLMQVTLKGGRHSRSPSVVSLTVETALGSFDFLNTSDWEEEDEDKGDKRNRNGRSVSVENRCWESSSSPTSPLSTGSNNLDCALVVHLKNCSAQLLRLGMFGPLRCGEMYALDKLLRESRVLEKIRHITKDNPQRFRQPNEVIPQLGLCQGAVLLWQQCVGQGSVYSITAESFLVTLSTAYCSILPEKASNLADTVFLSLVERVLDKRLPRRGNNRGKVILTLFQLWSYLEANSIIDMETHIAELAEEVWLVQRLASNNQDVIMQTLRCPAACSLRGEGLHAVAKLMKDSRSKVSASASSVLRSLATQPRQREQALVSCLELLEDENLDTRVCGCKALACLKAKESIDQLVYLCRTDKDEVRDAAKQALLMLGEEGKMAHRHVEISQNSIPRLFTPGSMASTAF